METVIQKKQNTHSFQMYMEHFQIDHMITHKTSFNKFKKIEIMSSIFLDHKDLKLETNLKKKIKTFKLMQTEKYAIEQWMG